MEIHGCEKMVVQGLNLQAQEKYSDATVVFKEATIVYPSDAIGWHFCCDDLDEALQKSYQS